MVSMQNKSSQESSQKLKETQLSIHKLEHVVNVCPPFSGTAYNFQHYGHTSKRKMSTPALWCPSSYEYGHNLASHMTPHGFFGDESLYGIWRHIEGEQVVGKYSGGALAWNWSKIFDDSLNSRGNFMVDNLSKVPNIWPQMRNWERGVQAGWWFASALDWLNF